MTDTTSQFVQPLLGWTTPAPLMSQSVAKISVALAHAQGEFESIDKSAANPFFKSSYAPLPEVVKAATPILAKHGLAVSQLVGHDDQGDVLWTVVFHDGEFIGSAMRMRPVKNDPQAQGSAITYARRYAYMAALGLVADEDDDGESAQGRGRPQSRTTRKETRAQQREPQSRESHDAGQPDDSQPIDDETAEKIASTVKQAKIPVKRLTDVIAEAGAKGKRVSQLTQDQANAVLLRLQRIAAAQAGELGED